MVKDTTCPSHGVEFGEEEMEKIMKQLIEGQHFLVNLGEDIPAGTPPWFDEKKFEAGKQFVKKYYGGIFFCHLVSLIMMLYSPQVLKPLIFTEKSETPKKSYRRYISTSIHVMSWYMGDMWQADSKARRSLRLVRQYHTDAATRLNSVEIRPSVDNTEITKCGLPLHKGQPILEVLQKDFSSIPNCPFLSQLNGSYKNADAFPVEQIPYLNQLDMSGTQFAFMGLVLLHPEKFGISRATERELEGFVHIWRCIGWILGIDDRFNFCRLDSLPQARRWTRYFADKLVCPSMKMSVTAEYEHMGRAVADGARCYTGISYETFYLFIAWVLGLPMPQLEKHASLADTFSFRRLTYIFGVIGNLPFGNYLINGIHYLTLKLIIDPPRFWPKRFRPPMIKGLKEFWVHT